MGGGWDLTDTDLASFIRNETREITLEPGRFFSENFGYAFSRVNSIKDAADATYLEGSISPSISMKWIRNTRFQVFPWGSEKMKLKNPVFYGGPTCFEGDTIQLTDNDTSSLEVSVGDYILFNHISGYSLAWNHTFNGIKAPVYYLGEK